MSSAAVAPAGPPLIVGLGGSPGGKSVTGGLLHTCLERVSTLGGAALAFDGDELAALPIYGTSDAPAGEVETALMEAVRRADAVIIATPGYHGGMSGLVKNALDHLEGLRTDSRPYLEGRAVGVIVSAAGWQAAGTTLVSVRSAIHALRGWPTPFGVTVNSIEQRPDAEGRFDDRVTGALDILAGQLMQFAAWRAAARAVV